MNAESQPAAQGNQLTMKRMGATSVIAASDLDGGSVRWTAAGRTPTRSAGVQRTNRPDRWRAALQRRRNVQLTSTCTRMLLCVNWRTESCDRDHGGLAAAASAMFGELLICRRATGVPLPERPMGHGTGPAVLGRRGTVSMSSGTLARSVASLSLVKVLRCRGRSSVSRPSLTC